MKEKIFYVVNLDQKRISILAVFFTGLLFSFFFLGVSVGKGRTLANAPLPTEPEISQSLPTTDPQPTEPKQEETVQLANRSPKSDTDLLPTPSIQGQDLGKTEVIDLQAPSENTERQAQIFEKQTPPPVVSKKTARKPSLSEDAMVRGGLYTIQLVAFSQKSDADFFRKKLIQDNPKLKTKPFVKQKGSLYLVRIGQSDSKDDLKKILTSLKLEEKVRSQAMIVKNS